MSDPSVADAQPAVRGLARRWPRRLRRVVSIAIVPVTVLASGLVVWQSSYASFNASTVNPSNSWTAGNVALSDSQGGSSAGATGTALWTSATGLKPGSTDTKCITVTYNGSLAASVKLYIAASGLTGTLGTYLRLSIDQSPTGTQSDCSDFGTATNIYNSGDSDDTKTLAAFAAASNDDANGVGTWAPTASGQTQTYRIKYTLLDNNAAMSATATAAFTWEADNT